MRLPRLPSACESQFMNLDLVFVRYYKPSILAGTAGHQRYAFAFHPSTRLPACLLNCTLDDYIYMRSPHLLSAYETHPTGSRL